MFWIVPPDPPVVPVPLIVKEPVAFDSVIPLLPPLAETDVNVMLRATLLATLAPAISMAGTDDAAIVPPGIVSDPVLAEILIGLTLFVAEELDTLEKLAANVLFDRFRALPLPDKAISVAVNVPAADPEILVPVVFPMFTPLMLLVVPRLIALSVPDVVVIEGLPASVPVVAGS